MIAKHLIICLTLCLALKIPALHALDVASGLPQETYTALLERYVDARGQVDYAGWKAHPEDLARLDAYLAQYAPAPENAAKGDERAAVLLNLYNALTLQWILQNYPTESIRALEASWTAARHRVGGQEVSLDAIEHTYLRPEFGYLVHAALVCAAKSCPPLQRQAYTAEHWRALAGEAFRAWLADPQLNTFLYPQQNRIEVSKIFEWFAEDFEAAGGLGPVLARYAPDAYRAFLREGSFELTFKDYDWSLNAQQP